MNRAERRRKERETTKKIYITQQQIDEMKKNASDDAFNKVLGCLYALPLKVLKEKYGFGKKRLQRFNDEMTDLLKEVEEDQDRLKDLLKEMQQYGIKFKGDD